MTPTEFAALARLHASRDRLALRLTGVPEDFRVRELMGDLPPAGDRYRWARVRHRGVGTLALAKALATDFGARAEDLTWSGRKDAAAVVEQWLCMPSARFDADAIAARCELLDTWATDERLSLGRHDANAFEIRLTAATIPDEDALRAWTECLSREGFPNYYGPQRFGDGAVADGTRLLAGELRLGRRTGRFALNAWQARAFNLYVDLWLRLGRPTSADDPVWHATAGIALPRQARPDATLAGPLFGYKLAPAQGEAGRREAEVLATTGWTWQAFKDRAERLGLVGARRPALAFPRELVVSSGPAHVTIRVVLDPGVYATSLVRELSDFA